MHGPCLPGLPRLPRVSVASLQAQYGKLKYSMFAIVFILVTPVGVAIGIGSSYNESSRAVLATEGAFNSLSAGESATLFD